MNDQFEDYRSFDSLETARFVLLDMLDKNDISYTIFKDPYRQDVILGRGMDLIEIWVRLKPEDFSRVNTLLQSEAEKRNEAIPADYYLREMNNQELLEILKKPDEWSIDDYIIARKLLSESEIDIPDEVIEEWKLERKAELKNLKRMEISFKRDEVDTGLSLWRGLGVFNSSVVDKDTGKREYLFNESERRRIRMMLLLGVIIFLTFFILQILKRSKI